MDVVFDIDGTLADATHRIHFIKDMAHWTSPEGKLPRPNWEEFLADEHVSKDGPILQIWKVMDALLAANHRVLFITGRPDRQRDCTVDWLLRHSTWVHATYASLSGYLYMRADGDRRSSSVSKEESLQRVRANGYNPTLVFEDRIDDTAMWRRNGLLCCQVADGDY